MINKLNRYIDPTKDPGVLLEMKGIQRKVGRYSKKVLIITSNILEKLIGSIEASSSPTRVKGFLSITCDSLFWQSELKLLLSKTLNIKRKITLQS
jgi:hypothetical protein